MRNYVSGIRPVQGSWRANYSSPQLRGLRAWFPLQDSPGVSSTREALYGRQYPNTALSGAGYQSGLLGRCQNYGVGSADYTNGSTDTQFSIAGDITLSAWVTVTSAAAVSKYIISHRSAAAGEAGGYSLALTSGNQIALTIYSGGFRNIGAGTAVLSTNQPYLVTGVFSDSTNTMNYYVNGLLDKTGSVTQALASANLPLYIGTAYLALGTTQTPFIGAITDVRIYNRALTAEEVWHLYDPLTRWELYDVALPGVFIPTAAPPVSSLFSPFIAGNV